ERTSFLMIIGSNPLVSRGSLVSMGNMREKMSGIVGRGGRVVVIDPRRTETARAYEHVAVRPDGDAWLLFAMLNVIFAEGLQDSAAIETQSQGIDAIRRAAIRYTAESVEIRTGIPAEDVRKLARDLAAAPSAAIHGRTGACLGRNATLVNVLIDVLNLVTGNLDRPGGLVFGRPPVNFAGLTSRAGVATYDSYRSRIGDFPEVIGQLPAPLMAAEIETPGPGQLRALIVSAGNPVLSVPGAERFEKALGKLDLQVGIDLYLNETHKHADYVLPAATFYERDDLVLVALDFHLTPFVQWTEPVIEPSGEAREDWRIIDALARELRVRPVAGLASSIFGTGRIGRIAAKAFVPFTGWVTPGRVVDILLRTGRDGDLYGLRKGGISVAKLKRNPRGLVLADNVETGVLRKKVRGGKLTLDDPRIEEAVARLESEPLPDPAYPLSMIGRRDVRSHNSWMHNTPKHQDERRRQRALVHPKDAAEAGISEGDLAKVVSATGVIELPVELTEDVGPGTVAVPHGWGHKNGSWQTANAAGGANVNELTSALADDLEPLSGMSHLNGVPVRLEPVG
ncbi:MAG: molybdopterin-dependent oxidoreductase, partial [Aeromicrobium sp.]